MQQSQIMLFSLYNALWSENSGTLLKFGSFKFAVVLVIITNINFSNQKILK